METISGRVGSAGDASEPSCPRVLGARDFRIYRQNNRTHAPRKRRQASAPVCFRFVENVLPNRDRKEALPRVLTELVGRYRKESGWFHHHEARCSASRLAVNRAP